MNREYFTSTPMQICDTILLYSS